MDTLTPQLAKLEQDAQELHEERERKKAELLERLTELEDSFYETPPENKLRRKRLQGDMKKLEMRLEDFSWGEATGKEQEIAHETSRMRKELANAEMDQKDMEDWMSQAALRIVDFMPAVPLYTVASMSEAQREEMIKDKLPARVPMAAATYQKAVVEGRAADAEANLHAIAQDTVTTSLELVEQGSLPDIRTNRMQKTYFLDRSAKVTTAVAGNAPTRELFKKELNKKAKGGCAKCGCKKETCFWDMDAGEPAGRQDENTTADVMRFCSESCMLDFRVMPVCPECGSDSKDEHVKKPGEGWCNPNIISEMGRRTQAILRIQEQMAAGGGDQEALRGELAIQKAALKNAEKNSALV